MSTTLAPNAKPLQITPVEFHEMPADRRVRFTVEQYEQLMRAGFLIEGSPIELLDGQLYWKDRRDRRSPDMTVGQRHILAVTLINAWLTGACKGHACFPFCQQALKLTSSDAPEPDGSVITGSIRDYLSREPEPEDVLLVIEVADSSLDRDLGDKFQLYASVAIPVYWIVNLADDTIEILERPDSVVRDYRQRTSFHKGGSVSLRLADGTVATTPVDELLP
jgi:Uma2 family endonuclease